MPKNFSSAAVAAALLAELPTQLSVQPQLDAAVRRSVSVSGHLLRGRLVATGALHQGATRATARRLAVAVEYFHLASLLLDDLPCMDNAVYRRGRPCLHHEFGEATTLLTALAFINRAYALVARALAKYPPAVRRSAERCLEAVLGPAGIVGGQARDLHYVAATGGARAVGRIAREKTGALFRLALVFPALLGRPSRRERRLLNALSIYLGLAYQTADDLQDVLGDVAGTGKTTRRDQELGRPNLLLALGPEAARARLSRYERLAARTFARLTAEDRRWTYLQSFLDAARPAARRGAEGRQLHTAA